MDKESVICTVQARRKGGKQAPCTWQVSFVDEGPQYQVVLRATDQGGVQPIVALLTPDEARELGVGLITAAARAE